MPETERPYLSIVTTARNDDHGKNFLQRMQICVNLMFEQIRRRRFRVEYVLVEWNPPSDRPSLAHAISWPDTEGFCRVRVIQVPQEIHTLYKYSDLLPLFQMRAKNVGIRRVRGNFVLATNTDIIFSDELIRFLAARHLKPHRMYRVDRYDVCSQIPVDANIDEQLRYCWDNILKIHGRFLSVDCTQKKPRLYWLNEKWKRWSREKWKRKTHTNACGDFTLMAREDWLELRGYPELEVRAMHLDSLLCYLAHYGPAREKFLSRPKVVFHVDHERSEGDTAYSEAVPVPMLSIGEVEEVARSGKRLIPNEEGWGIAKEDFHEETF